MAEFNRIFKKPTILDIIEGEFDGDLKLDSPDFKVIGWRVDAKTKKLVIEIYLTAMQGTVKQERTRMLTIDLITAPVAVRNYFINEYNLITGYVKARPELADGIEQ